MSSFEDERLRILARVSAGELTPQEGSLEIAMAKVRLGEGEGAAPEPQGRRARDPLPPLAKGPSKWAIYGLLAVPFLMLSVLMSVGMAFFLALPAYVFMAFWNGIVVPSAPGTVEIGFFSTLATLVFVSLVSTGLRWRRQLKVFSAGPTQGAPFGFSARWTSDDAPFVPGGQLHPPGHPGQSAPPDFARDEREP